MAPSLLTITIPWTFLCVCMRFKVSYTSDIVVIFYSYQNTSPNLNHSQYRTLLTCIINKLEAGYWKHDTQFIFEQINQVQYLFNISLIWLIYIQELSSLYSTICKLTKYEISSVLKFQPYQYAMTRRYTNYALGMQQSSIFYFIAMNEKQRYDYGGHSHHQSEADPRQFLQRPMIMISSDEEQDDRQLKSKLLNHNSDSFKTLTLVQPLKKKLINTQQIVKRFYSSQNLAYSLPPHTIRREASSSKDKQQESKLLKLFPSYKHFPMSSLRHVRNLLQILSQSPQYRIQKTRNETKQQLNIRQTEINRLTKTILFIFEEIKEIPEDQLNSYELRLRQMDEKSLQYCYKMANQIENSLYRSLYNKKKGNKIGVYYLDQIKMIIRECHDRNNFEFRRFLISNKKKQELEQIIKATDETFTCQKTKQERELQKKQFIRENQKLDLLAEKNQQQQFIPPPILNSIESLSPSRYFELPQREIEERKLRQKQQQKSKTKSIRKKFISKITNSLRQMKQRSIKLHQLGIKVNLPILSWKQQ